MGLIKALTSSVSGTLANQWKEYIYCDALENNVLVKKGQKKLNGKDVKNNGDENVISNGSAIAVNDGQCMIIVEQGKVVDICAEPGVFTYNNAIEPSLFTGNLGESVMQTFGRIGQRFTYGGATGSDQRVYFFNTKEIFGNKYGTASPVPFRVVDQNIGLDIDISVRCNGEYSYRITDPILFYTNVCGNVVEDYDKAQIESQLKSELMTALQPAFARISEMGVRYSAVPAHTTELATALNNELSTKWGGLRGIEIVSFGVNAIKASEEDEAMIKELQKSAVLRNPNMAAATLVGAQAAAMQAAAANTSTGPMMAFAGMNMANQAGGMNAQSLYQMGQQPMQQAPMGQPMQQPVQEAPMQQPVQAAPAQESVQAAAPAQEGWACACGSINKGKFCPECGAKKPADAPLYRCDKCGWEPEDPHHPPKFCPECGDPFNDGDIVG